MAITRRILTIVVILTAMTVAFSAGSAASAATFRYGGTGGLTGEQSSNQVFTVGAGTVTCTKATLQGTVTELETTDQKVTVKYSGCTAFGLASAEISPAEYALFASGTVEILNTITINVPLAGCHVTVGPQGPLSGVSYVNKASRLELQFKVGGIASEGSGGSCGGKSTGGTYTGSFLLDQMEGAVEWVA